MRNNFLKAIIKKVFFPDGSIRIIIFGPLKGHRYRISSHSGLAPLYSGVEREHQKVFSDLIKSGDTVIDVGANWGIHTLFMSKLVGPSGQVISIEPCSGTTTELLFNAKLNNCKNIIVKELAASEKNGETFLYIGDSSSINTIQASDGKSEYSEKIKVKIATLDSIVKEHGIDKVKLIKIDVEGAESKVLVGAKQILQNHRPYLIIDLHTPEQDLLVAKILTAHEYNLSRLGGPPITRLDLSWPNKEGVWGTIFASPRS